VPPAVLGVGFRAHCAERVQARTQFFAVCRKMQFALHQMQLQRGGERVAQQVEAAPVAGGDPDAFVRSAATGRIATRLQRPR